MAANISALEAKLAALNAQLDSIQSEIDSRAAAGIRAGDLQALILKQQSVIDQRDAVSSQIADAQAAQSQPIASAGQVVTQQQVAKDDGATTQDPQSPTGRIVKASDVNRNLDAETGTNPPTRTLTTSQATPPADPNSTQPVTTQTGGVGAARDDNTGANKNATQQTINANFSQKITARPNALDVYASYTYSISWYLLTPQQYDQAMAQQRKDISRWSLLVQSGGAPVQTNSANQAGRNQFFNVDYYLDNLVIENNFSGKGSGAARGVTEFTFQITEPNGITLIPTLHNAVTTLYRNQNPPVKFEGAWQQAQYCLCIRFYGYDENGNLVQAGRSGALGAAPNPSDPRAGIEKYIPFTITEITSKIVSRQIVYDVKCVPTSSGTGFATNRGTIPFAYELTGTTVGEVLNGRSATAKPAANGRTSAIAAANSRDGLATSILTGGSLNPETGTVGYAYGA